MHRRWLAVGLIVMGTVVGCQETVEQRRGSIYRMRQEPGGETAIRGMLGDPNGDVRATALNVLVGMKPPDAFDLALDALDDDSGFVRSIAAKLLGDVGNPAAVEALSQRLLSDTDPWVRNRSAEALTRLGGADAASALGQGLNDPIQSVRLAAVRGVRLLDPAGYPAALSRMVLQDSVWEVRAQAARALGESADPEVIPVLQRALEDPNEFVRAAAVHALALQGIEVELPEAPAQDPAAEAAETPESATPPDSTPTAPAPSDGAEGPAAEATG